MRERERASESTHDRERTSEWKRGRRGRERGRQREDEGERGNEQGRLLECVRE